MKQAKYFIFIFIMWPLAVLSQWSFDVKNNGILESETTLIFPITYEYNNCRFIFQVDTGGPTKTYQVINSAGCASNNHFLVIDQFQYQLPTGFEMEILSDQWSINGVVNLGSCSTASGQPILTGLPRLTVNTNQIQISNNSAFNTYVIDEVTYFVFNSSNGDISCTGGSPFNAPLNLIFTGDFE